MTYTDYVEIEFKIDGEWTHGGNVYPDYEWKIVRPWYLFGHRVPRIVNHRETMEFLARIHAMYAAYEIAYNPAGYIPCRLQLWTRRGRRLTKALLWEDE